MALLMVHQWRLKFIVRWLAICAGLRKTGAEVDGGVQGALERLRVAVEAHYGGGLMVMVMGH